jgi:hypothetical protein
VRATIYPGRLDLMDQWYAAQIKRRGRLMRVAGALFAASIPLALLPFAASAVAGPDRTLDVSGVRDGEKTHTRLRARHLPTDATVTMTIESGRSRRMLARGTADIGDDGGVTISLRAKSSDTLVIRATAVNAHGISLATRTLNMPRIK